MMNQNIEKSSYDLNAVLECLISDKNIVYGPSTFAEMYEEHIKNGGDTDIF